MPDTATYSKKKSYNTGDRRSFYCRVRNSSNETNKNNKRSMGSTDEPGKFQTILIH